MKITTRAVNQKLEAISQLEKDNAMYRLSCARKDLSEMMTGTMSASLYPAPEITSSLSTRKRNAPKLSMYAYCAPADRRYSMPTAFMYTGNPQPDLITNLKTQYYA